MPAQPFPTPPGFADLINQSTFNIFNASRHAWEASSGGMGWIFATALVILLVPIIIWQRSQNASAAAIGLLLITAGMHSYGLLMPEVWGGAYLMGIILLAVGIYSATRKRTD